MVFSSSYSNLTDRHFTASPLLCVCRIILPSVDNARASRDVPGDDRVPTGGSYEETPVDIRAGKNLIKGEARGAGVAGPESALINQRDVAALDFSGDQLLRFHN